MLRWRGPSTNWFPELTRYATDAERNEAYRRAYKDVVRSPRYWAIVIGAQIAAQVSVRLLLQMILHQFGGMQFSRMAGHIAVGIASALAAFGGLWLVRDRISLNLREDLRALGHAICLHCGYDLRGQLEPRCPECGTSAPLIGNTPPPATPSAAADSSPPEKQAAPCLDRSKHDAAS